MLKAHPPSATRSTPSSTETRQDFFFHLAGHAGLARAGVFGRVRIRVSWKRTIFFRWRFVEANALRGR